MDSIGHVRKTNKQTIAAMDSNKFTKETKHFKHTFNSEKLRALGPKRCVVCGSHAVRNTAKYRNTINTALYCEILRHLWNVLQNKKRGMLTFKIVLIHDNTCPHNADTT